MDSAAHVQALATELVQQCDPLSVDQFTFLGAQFDYGLAWVHYPVGKGGLNASPSLQSVVTRTLRDAGARYDGLRVNPIGLGSAAPTLLAYADEELQQKLLRPLFTGEHIWCQLFSEPGHGSDLAGLSTRAVPDDGQWIVNGQKVWTTMAHRASYAMLLARTDPELPKHKGTSFFILDMKSPGVEVRPLMQMTGQSEFNEVFLTDVRIPDRNRLGDRGSGWKVAISTLSSERANLGTSTPRRGSGAIGNALRLWSSRRDSFTPDEQEIMRNRLASLWIRAEAQRLTTARGRVRTPDRASSPPSVISKLVLSELNQDTFEEATRLLGAEAMLHSPGYPLTVLNDFQELRSTETTSEFLRSVANTIEGGTSEILRNQIGERVLGLPPDARGGADEPWSAVIRSAP